MTEQKPVDNVPSLAQLLDAKIPVSLSRNELRSIAEKIKNEVNDGCARNADMGFRNHMGASEIGEECERKIWLTFRHALRPAYYNDSTSEDVTGRMSRLFNRGHREEPEIIRHLSNAGFSVWEHDPVTGKQFRLSAHNGHFGGSLDGFCWSPDLAHLGVGLLEMKTYNRKRFDKLVKEGASKNAVYGMRASDPKYAGQMDTYAFAYELAWGLFVAVCKDDDDWYIEVVPLDVSHGESCYAKGGRLIHQQYPPSKIAMSEASFKCKFCNYKVLCHRGASVDINCRSCKYAKPVENARWFCTRWDAIIPPDAIPLACNEHISVVD